MSSQQRGRRNGGLSDALAFSDEYPCSPKASFINGVEEIERSDEHGNSSVGLTRPLEALLSGFAFEIAANKIILTNETIVLNILPAPSNR